MKHVSERCLQLTTSRGGGCEGVEEQRPPRVTGERRGVSTATGEKKRGGGGDRGRLRARERAVNTKNKKKSTIRIKRSQGVDPVTVLYYEFSSSAIMVPRERGVLHDENSRTQVGPLPWDSAVLSRTSLSPSIYLRIYLSIYFSIFISFSPRLSLPLPLTHLQARPRRVNLELSLAQDRSIRDRLEVDLDCVYSTTTTATRGCGGGGGRELHMRNNSNKQRVTLWRN